MPQDPDTGIFITPADYASQSCGPTDQYAKFPEPVHYDCKQCKALIVQLLISRQTPAAPKPKPATQLEGQWMDPDEAVRLGR